MFIAIKEASIERANNLQIFIEEFSKNYNIPFTILRYGSIYGPRSDIKNGVYKIVHDALKNKKAI